MLASISRHDLRPAGGPPGSDVALREETYESAARADEVLTLDVGDLDHRNWPLVIPGPAVESLRVPAWARTFGAA